MALNPIISWLNKDLIAFGDPAHPEIPAKIQFNDGVYNNPVLGDTDSAEITFYIANNFKKGEAAAEDCFDMKNCFLTVKADDGSMNAQIVQEKWVKAKCDSKSEIDFTEIGAHLDGATWVEDVLKIGCGDAAVGVDNISGLANDGDIAGTGKNNVAKISMKAHPTISATAGKHTFKFRLVYTFGTGLDA